MHADGTLDAEAARLIRPHDFRRGPACRTPAPSACICVHLRLNFLASSRAAAVRRVEPRQGEAPHHGEAFLTLHEVLLGTVHIGMGGGDRRRPVLVHGVLS